MDDGGEQRHEPVRNRTDHSDPGALARGRIDAELHILEAAAHGAFGSTSPEEAAIDREMRRFCEKWWS